VARRLATAASLRESQVKRPRRCPRTTDGTWIHHLSARHCWNSFFRPLGACLTWAHDGHM